MMREALSNNHFGQDNQLADVLNWLQRNQPSTFKSFLAEFPEWEQLKGDMAQVIAQLDPEWTSWAVDWIEAVTDIYWEEGEPWLETDKAKTK